MLTNDTVSVARKLATLVRSGVATTEDRQRLRVIYTLAQQEITEQK